MNISKEDFNNEILRIYKEHQIVNKNLWKMYSKYSNKNFQWYCHKYGGIKNILKENGIEYFYYNEISKEEIINRARNLYEKNKYINKELCCKNGISSCCVKKHFKNYTNLFEIIGAPINVNRNVSKEDLTKSIENFINEYNTLSYTLYKKYGKYSQRVVDRYGGWEFLIKEMGFVPQRNSGAENVISEYLSKNGYYFKIHYSFDWLVTKNENKMHVDFYLPIQNTVIEYNGLQHYKYVPYFHKTPGKFEENCERDVLKEKLIFLHNIKFFKIKYDEDIIEKLNEILN